MTEMTDIGSTVRTVGATLAMVAVATTGTTWVYQGFADVRDLRKDVQDLRKDVQDLHEKVTEPTSLQEQPAAGLTDLRTQVTALQAQVAELDALREQDAWAAFSKEYTLTVNSDSESDSMEMIPLDEGACFITKIDGPLQGRGERVAVSDIGGRWVLNVATDRQLSVGARCWRFPTLRDRGGQ
ncbi:MAG: hypothetical protein OXP28_12200 [Gammaproteobacteria bacterium]|nr:hypothetical protein [Gammaproteobacteria bacterium]